MVNEESQRIYFAFSINEGENSDTRRKAVADASREGASMFSLVPHFRSKFFPREGYSSQDLI